MQTDNEIRTFLQPSAVALGLFDGVHRAHQQVIRQAAEKKGPGVLLTVFTFPLEKGLPHTKQGRGESRVILTEVQRLERFEQLGVERTVLAPFDALADMAPETFFQEILIKRLNAQVISCGYDYSFGRGAAGSAELLEKLCRQEGIELRVLPRLEREGEIVSSTRIRALLAQGELAKANALLGYRYYLLGEVIHGRSLGRTLGFPTLNQRLLSEQVLPRFGVYSSITRIDGKSYDSITNIGVKPTIEGDRAPLAETYLLDASGDFYGKQARVELLRMTRPEQRFESLEALRAAVHNDIIDRRREQTR